MIVMTIVGLSFIFIAAFGLMTCIDHPPHPIRKWVTGYVALALLGAAMVTVGLG